MTKISFIGLGAMGFPMAGHLSQKYTTTIYARRPEVAKAWVEKYQHGRVAASLQEATAEADIVILCLGKDEDVREILDPHSGVLAFCQEQTTIIDHTTTSAKLAEDMVELAQSKSCQFLDAPVSGGQAGAENAALSIMLGGDQQAFHKVEPVLQTYAKKITYLGKTGNGQKTKMVNQICIAGLLQSLSEALDFAMKSGLDTNLVISAIEQGAAGSWQLSNRAKTMCENKFDFGFAVEWMCKDLGYALEESQKLGLSLETTNRILAKYQELKQKGRGRLDTSSLITLLNDSKASSK